MATKDFPSSTSLSLACYKIPLEKELNKKHERLNEFGTNPNPEFPNRKLQKKWIGDKGVQKFMEARLRQRTLNAKPIAQFDGKQAVNMHSRDPKPEAQFDNRQAVNNNMASSSHEYERKTLYSHQGLVGHRSSHYIGNENGPNQGNHECESCHRTFTSGQALGGHKRLHYKDKGLLKLKRKASSIATCLLPALKENSPSSTATTSTTTRSFPASTINSPSHKIDGVMLFGIDLKKLLQAQEDEDINLDLTL